MVTHLTKTRNRSIKVASLELIFIIFVGIYMLKLLNLWKFVCLENLLHLIPTKYIILLIPLVPRPGSTAWQMWTVTPDSGLLWLRVCCSASYRLNSPGSEMSEICEFVSHMKHISWWYAVQSSIHFWDHQYQVQNIWQRWEAN